MTRKKVFEIFDCPIISYEIVDGDTERCVIDRGWGVMLKVAVRLIGVDAPERSTDAGKAVREVTSAWITEVAKDQYRLRLISHELDKYGRSLGHIVDRETKESLSGFLLYHGLARKYEGGLRLAWGAEELAIVKSKAEQLLAEGW